MFRNGQWAAFDDAGQFRNAFRSRDGWAVCVFHGDGILHIVQEDGTNCTANIDGEMVDVCVRAADVLDRLRWIKDRRDIPAERIKHLPRDWQPVP